MPLCLYMIDYDGIQYVSLYYVCVCTRMHASMHVHMCALSAVKMLRRAPQSVMMEHRINPARLPMMSDKGPHAGQIYDLDENSMAEK